MAQVTTDPLAGAQGLFFTGVLAWHEPLDAVSILLLLPVTKPSKCSLYESSLFSRVGSSWPSSWCRMSLFSLC